ncbi:MAG: hypothetical protein WC884_02075 [Candidatus Paceibacterota bacterium]
MINIIFIVFAFYAILSKKVSLSKVFEIRRPKTYYLGIITIVSVIIAEILGRSFDPLSTFLYMGTISIPIIAILIFKERKTESPVAVEPTKWRKTENIISWVILGGLTAFFVSLYIYDLISQIGK